MLFVQRDDMIEDLAPATTDPTFRNAVLPGCLHARLFGLQTRCLQEGEHPGVELRVVIEDRVAIRAGLWERLAQLLDYPLRRRVGVTLRCRIFLRPCSMTKKQYSSLNVTVGTVKKSKATITSR